MGRGGGNLPVRWRLYGFAAAIPSLNYPSRGTSPALLAPSCFNRRVRNLPDSRLSTPGNDGLPDRFPFAPESFAREGDDLLIKRPRGNSEKSSP
jgi:hypothetical protein